MSRTVHRFRLAAVCLALVVLAFLQEPGRVAADTKLDLTVDPVGFLSRALHMWDGSGFFGQLQNQSYGYLWPVGPLFAALERVNVVAWVTQRTWWSILLLVGFLGFVRLARLMGIRSELARVTAGVAYVLSVRVLTELTTVSVEAWPMAVLPWLLIPLVLGSRAGSPRRWAALSGVAFFMTGAVNAVASAAVLPVAGLYVLTRTRTRRSVAMFGWWMLAVALAALWWVIPLLLLGRYSPPFLDWIESVAVTTGHNDPTSVLRGASHWVPYLADSRGPVWPGGWLLVSNRWAVGGTAAVALLGMAGLMLRRSTERVFLCMVLCLGVVLTGLGHVSNEGLSGLGALWLRDLLDAGLAPLRNVHKFQPLVTFPLAMGLALTIQAAREDRVGARLRWRAPLVATAGVTAVAVAALPALTGSLIGDRSFLEIPHYWQEASTWLDEQEDGRALVVPAASFGVYLWGRSQDEPLQALDTKSWAVRDAVPLSSAGNIRLLDEVQRYLVSGTGSDGLALALARSGVRWLVVRNDLDTKAARAALPILVHQALDSTPGISRAATFGPILSTFDSGGRIIDGGLLRAYPAVEVYAVRAQRQATSHGVVLRDARNVLTFTGSTEALPALADSGLLGDAPAIAEGDPIPVGSRVRSVVTDTYRRAEANFGAAQNQYSSTMTDEDQFHSDRPVHDYYPMDPTNRLSAAVSDGAVSVTASSSGSSPFAIRGRSQSAQPWSALDGDGQTAWISGDLSPGVGQWWQVDLADEVSASTIDVTLLGDNRVGELPELVTLSTEQGQRTVRVDQSLTDQALPIPGDGTFRSLRIRLAAVRGGGLGQGFGIAEVDIPGVIVARPVLTPPADGGGGLVLSARSMGREACAATDTAIVCNQDLAEAGEERAGIDRVVDVAEGGEYWVSTRLRPRPGTGLDAYLSAPANAVTIEASSQALSDPAARAQAAADQNRRTTWIASPLDDRPTLEVILPEKQRVTGLLLQTAPDAPASRPYEVHVEANGIPLTLYTDDEGNLELPELRTDRLTLRFGTVNPVLSTNSSTGSSQVLAVGVTELIVLGAPDSRMSQSENSRVVVPCGFGPSVSIDGQIAATTDVSATAGGILAGELAAGDSCGGTVTLSPGVHRIQVPATAEWSVEDVYLSPTRTTPASQREAPPTMVAWGDTERVLSAEVSSHPRFLETSENYNAGWQARIGDELLQPFRVDGWRQAFLVPAGVSGEIVLSYAPDRAYRGGLALGLAAVVALLLLVAIPTRRSGRDLALAGPAELRRSSVVVPLLAAAAMGGPIGIAGALIVTIAGVWRSRRSANSGLGLARTLGLVGVGLALGAQILWLWPGRIGIGPLYEGLVILGPAMALGALACLPMRRFDVPTAGSASPAEPS